MSEMWAYKREIGGLPMSDKEDELTIIGRPAGDDLSSKDPYDTIYIIIGTTRGYSEETWYVGAFISKKNAIEHLNLAQSRANNICCAMPPGKWDRELWSGKNEYDPQMIIDGQAPKYYIKKCRLIDWQ